MGRNNKQTTEVILIGAGVVSATLGTLLNKLQPDWHITLFEKLDAAGMESSNEWNNAGTGHAALCELNYTVEKQDGSIDIRKAVKINEQFQVSRQLWSHLVETGDILDPREFIRPLPHMSFVYGEKNTAFLKKRFDALSHHPQFQGMEFSNDPERLAEWMPLMMQDRTSSEPAAATKADHGTDVNFGELTRQMLKSLGQQDNVDIRYNHTVDDITQLQDGAWEVKVQNKEHQTLEEHHADFVFIGAGGGALPLLQKTGIPESRHIGGFPISGEFLVCHNPDIVEQHDAKVYGKEPEGTPPMTVPHLDRRHIEGKDTLLYGPFAGFTPKFLKSGSYMDLLYSVKPNNTFTMLAAGTKNTSLIKYLAKQLSMSKEQRMDELRNFVPSAKSEDWDMLVAGQRVQLIEDTKDGGRGALQFGTKLIHSDDQSLAALLGESPGASVSASIMLEVLEKCFPDYLNAWKPGIKQMIPSYGESLEDNPELLEHIHASSSRILGLNGSKT
ncbi:malate dehydrogenase (quinone) [Salibacterium halotolerans]|uniref:Probable malate:quinone oxidoreductase n=1 Tax=Salibacterium halotolerans TaxID=1884432 RepID=A0A1I5RN51_9BACI|nr:malate dehydrogenase (quinone) [Salibacterium halotolerans]SFP59691.1 malate dehydrogenase (quinone) [Salibacterium halotolerans]